MKSAICDLGTKASGQNLLPSSQPTVTLALRSHKVLVQKKIPSGMSVNGLLPGAQTAAWSCPLERTESANRNALNKRCMQPPCLATLEQSLSSPARDPRGPTAASDPLPR